MKAERGTNHSAKVANSLNGFWDLSEMVNFFVGNFVGKKEFIATYRYAYVVNMQKIKQISGSVALFVHWSTDDKVSAADQNLINALEDVFDFVLVVKNLNSNKKRQDSIVGVNDKTLHLGRQNIGYDFGGYVAGMNHLANQKQLLNEILILNNSVFLAAPNLRETIDKVRCAGSNVTAMTNSSEIKDHLQSYFIHFDASCLVTDGFWEYWEKVETYDAKSLTVQNLELGLAAKMNELGLSCGSLFKYSDITKFALSPIGLSQTAAYRNDPGFIHALNSARDANPLNPTHYFWFWLRELGYPFLKKDLLRDFRDLGLEDWSKEIPQEFAKNIRSELKNRDLKK